MLQLGNAVLPIPSPSSTLPNLLKTDQRPATLYIEPDVVHFPISSLDTPMKKVVRVLNASSRAFRLMITGPTSTAFRMTFKTSGSIVPGGHAEITIEFQPSEWRYYHDVVRVATSSGMSRKIPIHGYPMIDEDFFPRKIRFGKVPLFETRTKTIPLRCSVPNPFDYEISVDAHPRNSFAVKPIRGVVKGGTDIPIRIDFTPLTAQPALMRLTISTAQFGSTPRICHVTGVGFVEEPKLESPATPLDGAQSPEIPSQEQVEHGEDRKVLRKAKKKKLPVGDRTRPTSSHSPTGKDAFSIEVKTRRDEERRKEVRRFVSIGEEELNVSVVQAPASSTRGIPTWRLFREGSPIITTSRVKVSGDAVRHQTLAVNDNAAEWARKKRERHIQRYVLLLRSGACEEFEIESIMDSQNEPSSAEKDILEDIEFIKSIVIKPDVTHSRQPFLVSVFCGENTEIIFVDEAEDKSSAYTGGAL
ncbi:Cilia- and flagella-associated protein 221 [Borealophlyctis nickersoniae]|nr:Cilia- and flagella-associated protein 221 [Borealophlyctis nickersoniae]